MNCRRTSARLALSSAIRASESGFAAAQNLGDRKSDCPLKKSPTDCSDIRRRPISYLEIYLTYVAGVGLAPRRSVVAEDIRDLQNRTPHDRRGLCGRLVTTIYPLGAPLNLTRGIVMEAVYAIVHFVSIVFVYQLVLRFLLPPLF